MNIHLHKRGAVAIWFVVTDDDTIPVIDFLNSIDQITRRKTLRLLDRSAENGPPEGRIERFEHLRGSVYEFKEHSPTAIRLFCFRTKDGYVITHGCKKPKKKQYKVHIESALRIMEELSQEGGVLNA